MAAVGNHEHGDDFAQFLARFDAARSGAGARRRAVSPPSRLLVP